MNVKQIGDYIKKGGKETSDFDFFEHLTNFLTKIPNIGTKEKYETTLSVLKEYTKTLFFSDITKPWLHRFKEWRMSQVSAATTNIDLRNIRAILNRAIDVDKIIGQEMYPFRKFEFPKAEPRNLRLPIKKIRAIREFQILSIGKGGVIAPQFYFKEFSNNYLQKHQLATEYSQPCYYCYKNQIYYKLEETFE